MSAKTLKAVERAAMRRYKHKSAWIKSSLAKDYLRYKVAIKALDGACARHAANKRKP